MREELLRLKHAVGFSRLLQVIRCGRTLSPYSNSLKYTAVTGEQHGMEIGLDLIIFCPGSEGKLDDAAGMLFLTLYVTVR